MNICLLTREEMQNPLPINDERAEHIIKILKKKEGDSFTAGEIGGMAGKALITKIDDSLHFEFTPETDGKPLNRLSMIIGFPRPIQLKRLLRDIAALGVKEVHLTGTELGEKSYMQSTLVERGAAYKMLLDGTVQAGSTHIPELFLHQTLADCILSLKKQNALKMALDNVNPADSLVHFLNGKEHCPDFIAAIGSERGWTDKERFFLQENGFTRLGMGSRIMRTETAATAAASIILGATGQLC